MFCPAHRGDSCRKAISCRAQCSLMRRPIQRTTGTAQLLSSFTAHRVLQHAACRLH